MRLSLAKLKEQSKGIVKTEILQVIQGGNNEECHVDPTDLMYSDEDLIIGCDEIPD